MKKIKFLILAIMLVLPNTSQGLSMSSDFPAGSLLALEGVEQAAVYYIGLDGKKHVFPDDKTYFSWYKDFSDVVKVDIATLDMYEDGSGMTYRPGTNLITHVDTAKIYAVEPNGVLVWIPDEQTAIGLYGQNWGERVKDIAPGYFSTLYTNYDEVIGSTHPYGTLLKYNNEYYMVYNSSVRKFEGSGLEDNRIDTSQAILVDNIDVYDLSVPISGEESQITNPFPGVAVPGGSDDSSDDTTNDQTNGDQTDTTDPEPVVLYPIVEVLPFDGDGILKSTGQTNQELDFLKFSVTNPFDHRIGLYKFRIVMNVTDVTFLNSEFALYESSSANVRGSEIATIDDIAISIDGSTYTADILFDVGNDHPAETNPEHKVLEANQTIYFTFRGEVMDLDSVADDQGLDVVLSFDSGQSASNKTAIELIDSSSFIWRELDIENYNSTQVTNMTGWKNGYGLPGASASALTTQEITD